MTIINSFQMFL